jgi:prefoldin subunit 5
MLSPNENAPQNNMNTDALALHEAFDAAFMSNTESSACSERDEINEELTVNEAAKIRGRSPRQIRRLLQSGNLAGYKIMGANGPEWRVLLSQDVRTPKIDFSLVQPNNDHSEHFNNILANITDRIETITKNMELFENAMKRVDKLAITFEQLQSEVDRLKEVNKRNESIVNELHNLQGQQSTIEFVESEVRHHKEALDELAAARSKSSWWKRAFSS